VFTFEAQEGRLFKPPALTKKFATGEARTALDHAGAGAEAAFVRGRILAEVRNPINRALIWLYRPAIASVLRARPPTILLAVLVLETPLPQQELLITGRLQMRLEYIKKGPVPPAIWRYKDPKEHLRKFAAPLN
jgi:Cu/Ag efflux pump CusA